LEDVDVDGSIIWFREELDVKRLKKGRIYGIILNSIVRLTIQ
jgi:hypothetical protein